MLWHAISRFSFRGNVFDRVLFLERERRTFSTFVCSGEHISAECFKNEGKKHCLTRLKSLKLHDNLLVGNKWMPEFSIFFSACLAAGNSLQGRRTFSRFTAALMERFSFLK